MSEKDKRIQDIAYNFRKIKEAHFWMKQHWEGVEVIEKDKRVGEKILNALERVYTILERLGVKKEFSSALFIFGDVATKAFAEEFKNG